MHQIVIIPHKKNVISVKEAQDWKDEIVKVE